MTASEYPKINSIFKRDERGDFILGEWSKPEFEYLSLNKWVFTEKIDGTNIRVIWDAETQTVKFGGKTDNAQIPVFLYDKLQEMFPVAKFLNIGSMCMYGEGYGRKIQKAGSSYIPDGVSFILFDVRIGFWWLRRDSIKEIAERMGINVVPVVGEGNIYDAISMVRHGYKSQIADCQAEGVVLRPRVDLLERSGQRIITKIKTKDFK